MFVFIGDDSPCWGINGRCQYTSEPCGRYRPGYCAGPTNRQCCVIGISSDYFKTLDKRIIIKKDNRTKTSMIIKK